MPDGDISLTLHRTIHAPVEAVFSAWTDPAVMRRWLFPGECDSVSVQADPVAGGRFRVEMRSASGGSHVSTGTYREVVPNRRLAKTWRWEGSDVETLLTVEFEAASPTTTRLTLTQTRFAEARARDLHREGWSGCLDRLEALHPAD